LSAPFDLSLLPASAATDAAGRTSIAGVDLVEVAERFGTPCYVYDETELRARCRAYRAQFGDGAAYAGKAFLCLAMARVVDEEGMHLDVATGGELFVALRAGFPADRILFHGNNKSEAELRAALTAGVGRIVADSDEELTRLEALVGAGASPPRVQIRVRPGVEAFTHEHIETGGEDSKFGFGLDSGEALAAARRVAGRGVLRFAGIHCHIGSHVFRLDAFTRAVERMVGLVHAIEEFTPVEELNLGGGLGVRYVAGDEPPGIDEYASVMKEAVAKALADAGVRSRPLLMVEPGRSIAGPAGLTLYTIGTIKRIEGKRIDGVRTYVAVDGGMSDNLRPVAYGARYEAFLPARATAERALEVTIAGKHCEQGDIVVRDAWLPRDARVGEVLATPVTGAYGHVMASNYNKVGRPPVVFLRDGRAREVVERETDEMLVSRDVEL
jgi:diaminopimelate decarboxylase